MRIVIDGRMYNESGIGRYIRNLIAQLQIIDHKNEFFILLLKNDFDNLKFSENFHKVLADFRWYGVKEQLKLPKILKYLNPDLVHFPHFNVPLLFSGKFIVTVHDLIHQHFSMGRTTTHGPLVYKLKQLGYRKVFSAAVDKAEKILVPSDFVRSQLVKDWKIDNDRLAVTYEAVDDKMLDIIQEPEVKNQEILKKYNIKKPYIFYAGNAHPHKNVEGLIKVFGGLREKHDDLSLVLSGNDHYFWKRIRKNFQKEGIIYTGFVSDEELVGLYKGAKAFIMPSFEEGFGIPILEAMACGCPVVSSDKGSLPEVGKDAAVYFNPEDPKDMADKIDMVLKSEGKRVDLIEKGLKRCKEFSWKKLAGKTLEVYEKCV